MVAADDDRRGNLAAADHLVEAQPEAMTLAVAEPADPRRQALEGDPLAGQGDPPVQASSSGNSSSTARSVAAMSAGSPDRATHRNGPLPSQNSGRMYAGRKPG